MHQANRLIDLSHPIETGMAAYPGLPSPRIEPLVSHAASRTTYAGRAEFTITRLSMVGNTGTYLDAPWHRHPEGPDLAGLPIERLARLDAMCLDGRADEDGAIRFGAGEADVAGKAVLIRTGWDRRWGERDYWLSGPHLHQSTVDLLLAGSATLVGVDFSNVDDTDDPARPAHTRLLGANIPIVEHLTGLQPLPRTGFRFTAVPPAIRGAGSFPVRAFAELRD